MWFFFKNIKKSNLYHSFSDKNWQNFHTFVLNFNMNKIGSRWKGPIPLLTTFFYFLLYINILSLIFSYLIGEMRVKSSRIESRGMLLNDIVYMEFSKDWSINTISLLNLRDNSLDISSRRVSVKYRLFVFQPE